MTAVEIPSGTHMTERWVGGRFRLDERISLDDQVSGPCGSSWEARGLSLWKATDRLLTRAVTIYLLPRGPVPRAVIDAVQSAAKVSDPRLATIYDTGFDEQCPYIVAEWTPGTHLEDLVLSGLPNPALAAAMIAAAAWTRPFAGRFWTARARRTRWRPTRPRWPGCCTRCSPGTGPARSPPHCRLRPGTRGTCARRARSVPGCPPCWTPSSTAACRDRPPTLPCGRRPRPGWPWRSAWCSGRHTGWNGWRASRSSGPAA